MLIKIFKKQDRIKCIFLILYGRKNKCRGFGFGKRNGIYKNNDFVPGPGAYEKNQNKESKDLSPSSTTFGRSPRNVRHNTSPLGPG
jgi:hypothetical protein